MELELYNGEVGAVTKPAKIRAKANRRHALALTALGLGLLWAFLQGWMLTAEMRVRVAPDYPRQPLGALLAKEQLSQADYHSLLMQTGLGRPGVDYMRSTGQSLLPLQEAFFERPNIHCDKNTPVSAEEFLVDDSGRRRPGTRLVGLEDGDILITPCCHTFGWRNGHAALVVDARQGIALESVVMGQNSSFQKTDKWASFPAFMVFRLKDAPAQLRAEVAQYAVQALHDLPYGLTVGLFSQKFSAGGSASTHCAHLVWQAFRQFGYDLDANAGPVVTPRDLSLSPLLELKQVYGLDPEALWGRPEGAFG